MKTLRTAAKKANLDQPTLSIQDLATTRKVLSQPVSVLRLLNHLQPEQVIWETGEVAVGDVSGWGQLAVLSSGWISWRGHLEDDGDFYGDDYAFAVVLKHPDGSGTGYGLKDEGHIDGGESTSFQVDAYDAWIEANWDAIKTKGYVWKLHADPAVGPDEVLEFILKDLGVAVALVGIVVVMFIAGSEGSGCEWAQPPEGQEGVEVHCPVEY